jgi:hypothetical protein
MMRVVLVFIVELVSFASRPNLRIDESPHPYRRGFVRLDLVVSARGARGVHQKHVPGALIGDLRNDACEHEHDLSIPFFVGRNLEVR